VRFTGKDDRACLYYDIKLCSAPCIGAVNQDEYRQMIDDLCKFLEGRTDPIMRRLKESWTKLRKTLITKEQQFTGSDPGD
jgi:excinuclease ABC subunit C